jgi:uncharacterized membrane protein YeaQ/YmgE (transglycosylase-associated protein family)
VNAAAISRPDSSALGKLGWAWVGFCLAVALHVADEASTGFLSVYNPTILAIRPAGWGFPPTFEFRGWLTALILAVVFGLALSPLFFQGYRGVRPVGYFLAIVVGIVNALGHITGTILGHTVSSVRFARPMPGFYSSPILLAAAVYLLVCLKNCKTG